MIDVRSKQPCRSRRNGRQQHIGARSSLCFFSSIAIPQIKINSHGTSTTEAPSSSETQQPREKSNHQHASRNPHFYIALLASTEASATFFSAGEKWRRRDTDWPLRKACKRDSGKIYTLSQGRAARFSLKVWVCNSFVFKNIGGGDRKVSMNASMVWARCSTAVPKVRELVMQVRSIREPCSSTFRKPARSKV